MTDTKSPTIPKRFQRVYSNDYKKHYDCYGVFHDRKLVVEKTNRGFNSKELLINNLLSEPKKLGRTFIHFASGITKLEERYNNIPFDTFFLIDYLHEDFKCIITENHKRIYCLPCDLITGLCVLNAAGIKADAICSSNDGLELGFGFYSCLSSMCLSVAEPLFKDELLVFASKSYQKSHGSYQVVKNFLSLPFSKKKTIVSKDDLISNNIDFDFSLLTTYHHVKAPIEVYRFNTKVFSNDKVFKYKGLNIHLIKANIFNYYNELDMLMLIFRNAFQYKHFKFNFNKVVEARGSYRYKGKEYDLNNANNLLDFTQKLNIKSIGFTPQNNKSKNWVELIEALSTSSTISDLYFFHIHNNDFNQLYRLLELNRN